MATKQHCDICDSVIPGDESFRVIRYGRGQNYDVQTGNDPKIICKTCWNKMWSAVSSEQPRDIDGIINQKFMSKEEAHELQKTVSKNSDAINSIHNILKEMSKGTESTDDKYERTCKTCSYGDVLSMNEPPCNQCNGFSNWEAKNED